MLLKHHALLGGTGGFRLAPTNCKQKPGLGYKTEGKPPLSPCNHVGIFVNPAKSYYVGVYKKVCRFFNIPDMVTWWTVPPGVNPRPWCWSKIVGPNYWTTGLKCVIY